MLRNEIIIPLVRGKKVLDCGGVDHWAFQFKQDRGDWLHAEVAAIASSCLGIDILEEHVDKINDMGKYRFEAHNVESLPYTEEYDVVIAGELAEHLYNLGLFLDSAWRSLVPDGLLIITTPNAYALSPWLRAALTGKEQCHPEHTCYLSPQTLSYVVSKHGFAVRAVHLAERPAHNRIIAGLRSLIGRVRPILSEQLVLVAEKVGSQNKYHGKW